ncbi:MAG: phosphoenolpyruvate--protein phosphotransferase [Propionibacteriaceae bacterium]|jgi:phosphotransferase system enzyme I (PtsI)|nr:phosphoenolpyruvate--protein phosphotransferase [Propionibacteriaceae bacterium]
MIELTGQGVYGAIAAGPLKFIKRTTAPVVRRAGEPDAEWARFEAAQAQAIAELADLHAQALAEVGEQGAMVFEVHQMMVADEDYCDSVRDILAGERVNAEYAVSVTGSNFARIFAEMDDPYMRERAADVHDISERLIRCLTGAAGVGIDADAPVIVAADDLTPSETVQLDKSRLLGFVTARGSTTSHSAILARTLGIPAVVGVGELDEALDGEYAVVNGFTGEVFVRPDEATLATVLAAKAEAESRSELLQAYRGRPSVTQGGRQVELCANIGSPGEVGAVLESDAEGVGLFRTEFGFMEHESTPSEEDLFAAYKAVVEALGDRRVVFRTLDVGADKQIPYLDLAPEENPALGLRGLRLCLRRPEIFRTQLRALLRAAAFGRVAIMFPMVASLWEVQAAKARVAEARAELEAEGVAIGATEIGIMIETPAAALISDQLAPEVDFFSIGTNDLTQYTLAVDRQHPDLAEFTDTHHEAVLRLIAQVAANAHAHGAWVGICGELGADLTLTPRFVELGIDELSVAPASVLAIRERICTLD